MLDRHIDSLGIVRPLGLVEIKPTSELPRGMFSTPLIPESEWQEFDLTSDPSYPLVVKDQNGYGACNGHATATSMELSRWLHGQPHVPLSGWFPYAILCGGLDTGSTISEALSLIQKTGLAPETQVAYGTINPTKLTREAYDIATNYRCEIGIPLATWEEIMSAVQSRMCAVNLSVHVPRLFRWNLDGEGVVPAYRGGGNHAISAGHGAKKLKNGEWAIKWQNSWTNQWGDHGYAWYTRQHWELQSMREAWVIATPIESPMNTVPPIIV